MNIQNRVIDDFLNELINEQTSQSQTVKTSENKQETLKNVKILNQVISLVYGLKDIIQKQKDEKDSSKAQSKK